MTRTQWKVISIARWILILIIVMSYLQCPLLADSYKCELISGKNISPYWQLEENGQIQKDVRFENMDKCLKEVKKRMKKKEVSREKPKKM